MPLNGNNVNTNELQYYLICTLPLLRSLNSISDYSLTRRFARHTQMLVKLQLFMAHKPVQQNVTNGRQLGGFISLSSYALKRSRIMAAFFSHKPYATVPIITKIIQLSPMLGVSKICFIFQIIKTLQHIIHITNFYFHISMY